MKELSLKVREKRGDRGIRAVAAEIGISHTTLARIEAGKQPDLKTFGLVCKWLEVDPNIVLGFSSSPATHDSALLMPVVHFRASRTMRPETARHLAELILAVQKTATESTLPR